MANNTTALWSHISNPDGNWGTMLFKKATLTRAPVSIHFVAQENVDNVGDGGQPPTNHWNAFLAIDDTTSVRLEAVPGEVGRPGMIVVDSDENYKLSSGNAVVVSADFRAGTLLADVFRLIIEKGRDRYKFAPIGEGCRFWFYTLAQDLADAGLITQQAAAEVREALPKYYPSPRGTTPKDRAMAVGTFFN